MGLVCGLGSILYFTRSEMDQNTLKIKLPTQEKCTKIIDEAIQNLENKYNDKQQEFLDKNHFQDIMTSGDTTKLKELEKEFLNTVGKDYFVTGSKFISASDIFCSETKDSGFKYKNLSNSLRNLEGTMQEYGIEIPKIPDVHIRETANPLKMNRQIQEECAKKIHEATDKIEKNLEAHGININDHSLRYATDMTSNPSRLSRQQEIDKEYLSNEGKKNIVNAFKLIDVWQKFIPEIEIDDFYDFGPPYYQDRPFSSIPALIALYRHYGIELPELSNIPKSIMEEVRKIEAEAADGTLYESALNNRAVAEVATD